MSITTTCAINELLKGVDFGADFIAVRVKNDKKTLIYSNMPDHFKAMYYQNSWNNVDDTFYRQEQHGDILYPCSSMGYQSDYIALAEEAGYFNQVALSFKMGSIRVGCITGGKELHFDLKNRFQKYKPEILKALRLILMHFSEDFANNFISSPSSIREEIKQLFLA
ncbi:MAG: hypothetical protein PUP46_00250 [Endozoicomonas sp. (ex Botrylloides leachii)]|nr:hypothetical protein [Endozoicomonas sp. (ex Botrylloides leachii)]